MPANELTLTGYSKRTVAVSLEDLALSEVVTTKKQGNRIGYRLQALAHLTGLAPALRNAHLVRWDLRLALIAGLLALVAEVEEKKPIVRSADARRFMDEHTTTLEELELTAPDVSDPVTDFETLVTWARDEIVG